MSAKYHSGEYIRPRIVQTKSKPCDRRTSVVGDKDRLGSQISLWQFGFEYRFSPIDQLESIFIGTIYYIVYLDISV
jgi:hypothetical protein